MSRQRALQLMLAIAWLQVTFMARATPTIAKPGCDDACGNIKIPYPFGIGASCANNSWFEIFCNGSNSPPKPFLRRLNLEVMDIQPRDVLVATQALRICAGRAVGSARPVRSINLGGSPYRFSLDRNVLFARLVTGCAGSVMITNQTDQVIAGCSSICGRINSTASDTCFGMGCCQSIILNQNLSFFQIGFNNEVVIKHYTCIEAGLVQMLQDQNSLTLDPRVLLDPSPAATECKKCKWKGNCVLVYNGNGGDGGLWLSSYRCERTMLKRFATILGKHKEASVFKLVESGLKSGLQAHAFHASDLVSDLQACRICSRIWSSSSHFPGGSHLLGSGVLGSNVPVPDLGSWISVVPVPISNHSILSNVL
ncbi:hypothetical protein Drorol1_Dr00024926 [Drosera rotundifolia]